MTKQKLKLLHQLLGELLQDERKEFARDTGLHIEDGDYARLMRPYLGKDLPRLGSSREEAQESPRSRRVRDSADAAAQFEADCRALRLKLQRG